jgi:hypothetical protein
LNSRTVTKSGVISERTSTRELADCRPVLCTASWVADPAVAYMRGTKKGTGHHCTDSNSGALISSFYSYSNPIRAVSGS